ncbi:MAG: ATP-dependent sacrificial sulfur transferase LarE [Candidatus Aminicenantes bacterium]|nr:ATP-dependent sacrificial sulfur transferase LarE [Candidatus Aminicenantes bacterium]
MERVKEILSKFKGGIIAFSGGKDSLALCLLAKEVFGKKYLCITVKFPYTHSWILEKSRELAKKFSLKHKIVELPIPYELKENQPLRCYWCKKRMFEELKKQLKRGWVVMEGSTKEEEERDGLRAAWEEGVVSPFVDAGITQKSVKKFLKELGVEEIPSETCLLTRIPLRTKVDINLLKRIEKLEDLIREYGIGKVRARWHNGVLRIEVPEEEIEKVIRIKKEVLKKARRLKFPFVCLDLSGYSRGSMNNL